MPDFKILDDNADFSTPGKHLFSYSRDINGFSRHGQVVNNIPGRNDVKVNVFSVPPCPATTHSPGQYHNKDEITGSTNIDTSGLPGVVIKCQIDNNRDDHGTPTYSVGGNLTPQLSGQPCVLQQWITPAGTQVITEKGPEFSDELTKWIQLSGLSLTTSALDKEEDDDAFKSLTQVRTDEGNRYCPSTFLQIYFTYDYGSPHLREYFKDVNVVSGIENRGTTVRHATFVKKGNVYEGIHDDYIQHVKEHISLARIVPWVDQAFETKGYIQIVDIQGESRRRDDRTHVSREDDSLGTNYINYEVNFITECTKRVATFGFHDFIVPDVINMLGQSFIKTSETDDTMQTIQPTASNNYFGRDDRRTYDGALAYLSMRFNWPLFGTSISDNLYYRLGRGFVGDFSSNIPEFVEPSSAYNHYHEIIGLGDVLSGTSTTRGVSRPWRAKTGTAIYPARATVQMNNTFSKVSFLDYHTASVKNLHPRLVSIKNNRLSISQKETTLRPDHGKLFTNILGEYVTTTGSASQLSPKVFDDSPVDQSLTSITSGGPTTLSFRTSEFHNDNIHTITKQLDGNIVLGLDTTIRELVGGLNDPTGDNIILGTGASSNILFDGGYLLFADKNNIAQPRFSREAQNFLQNNVNDETHDIDNIDTMVSLFSRHRVFLLHKSGSQKIYCLAAGEDRTFKGLSVMEFPISIRRIIKFDPDKIILLSQQGLHTIDFSSDKNKDYFDEINDVRHETFEAAFTTLPIFVLTDTEYSVFYSTTIPRATVALSGFPEFTFQVLNRENKVIAERSLRKVGREVSSVPHFSGPFLIDRLPTSASESPKVRLTKTTDKYLSISSMVLDLGNIGRDKVGGRQ